MRQKFTLIIITLMVITGTALSQPTVQWQKSLGGSKGDISNSMALTNDGGYILAGQTASSNGDVTGNHGGADYWIVKVNNTGNIEWQKSLGGIAYEEAYSVKQTSDNGYIIAGGSKSNDGDVTGHHGTDSSKADYWIVKLNSAGVIEWEKSLGGTGNEIAKSVQQTSDGGYIVAGSSNSTDGDVTGNHGGKDYWIVKLSGTGTILWQKSLGGTADDDAFAIEQTPDNGYIVAGGSSSVDGDVTGNHGARDYWIVKLDSNGNIGFQKSYGGSNDEAALSIKVTTDGGYSVAGRSASSDGDVSGNNGQEDYWLLKLNNIGTIKWSKSFGGSDNEEANSIQQTSDGGYIVAGFTASDDFTVDSNHNKLTPDAWLLKLNSAGVIQWRKCYGGTETEDATQVFETADKGYVFAGVSNSNDGDVSGNHGNFDSWLVKLNPDPILLPLQLGNFSAKQDGNAIVCLWQTLQEQNVAKFIVEYSTNGTTFTELGTVYAVGNSDNINSYSFTHNNPQTGNNYYKLKMVDKDGKFTYSKIINVVFGNQQLALKVYPNPATTYVVVEHPVSAKPAELKLLDATGRIVKNKTVSEGAMQTSVNVKNLAPGVYTVIWTNGVDKMSKTLMVK